MDSADAKIAGGGSTTAAHTSEPLTLKTKLLYGAPSFAGAGMVIPIFINMPKFYADTVLVPLGYLAMAIAIARSLDALSDPLMGWISDHTHTRLGRRRPYILIGAPLCGDCIFLPAESAGGADRRARRDVVRHNLHPLLYISHSLRFAALRTRPRADAEL